MTLPLPEVDRQVIPRWRSSGATAVLGELASLEAPSVSFEHQNEYLEERVRDWKRFRTLSFATDLVSTAVVIGAAEHAKDAAIFILEHPNATSSLVRALASQVLGKNPKGPNTRLISTLGDFNVETIRSRVRELKQRLNNYPRNSIAWVDIALEYASLGASDQAVRSIEKALALAPDNRFILRSAARLFVHRKEFDRALSLLRSSPTSKEDPWIMAAEIAVAGKAKESSKLAKVGNAMVLSDQVSPYHLSELASALGTLEYSSGRLRAARKLFKLSTESPTENAVAQAEWAARYLRLIDFEPTLLQKPATFEAKAREYLRAGKFKDSLHESRMWFVDQRFSTEPAIHGSFVASVGLQNYDEAIRFVEQGLVANPQNWILRNNHAFALASLNRVSEAEKIISTIALDAENKISEGTILATQGLIEFRKGQIESGRSLYLKSLEIFDKPEWKRQKALASIFLAREEVNAATSEAVGAVRRVEEILKGFPSDDLKHWVDILHNSESSNSAS